jgi:hypothetical protein
MQIKLPTTSENITGRITFSLTEEQGKTRASFVGVYYPIGRPNAGGGGQCQDSIGKLWGNIFWIPTLLALWERWHLNDMRAGCEHQRAEKWGNETLEVVSYKLTMEAIAVRKGAEKKASAAAILGTVAEIDETERALLACVWYKNIFAPPSSESPLSGCYEVSKRETKPACHVYPHEHARGVLCKPCPVCSYEYGKAWLYEELPADLSEQVQNLKTAIESAK